MRMGRTPRDPLRSLGESTLVSWLARGLQNWRMVAHGGLASALPILVHSEEEEQVNVLVGVQHAPPYGVGKTAQEVRVGQQAVAADPGARWFDPGIPFAWTEGTVWGLTDTLKEQLKQFEFPVERRFD